MSDLFSLLPQAAPEKGPWILVTLVKVEGSTYRKSGAHLLVNREGYVGMLSGGCLEAEVAARCGPILEGQAECLEMAIDTRRLLGCHGKLTLLAEVLPAQLPAQVAECARQREPGTLCSHRPGPGWRPSRVVKRLPEGAYGQELHPPLRLLVFGSAPGAAPLLQMAKVLGWQGEQLVLYGDPAVRRQPNASWTILSQASGVLIDARTACVVMNHHVGRDTEVLHALWNTPTPFLGLLGSRRRREEILERLAFAEDGLDFDNRHLYAPVGIDLGAEGAPEIALEICAQIQSVMARKESSTESAPRAQLFSA